MILWSWDSKIDLVAAPIPEADPVIAMVFVSLIFIPFYSSLMNFCLGWVFSLRLLRLARQLEWYWAIALLKLRKLRKTIFESQPLNLIANTLLISPPDVSQFGKHVS